VVSKVQGDDDIDADVTDFHTTVHRHYERAWTAPARSVRWTEGPTHELPDGFHVLVFPATLKRSMWTYATCGMSSGAGAHALELHMFAPGEDDSLAELLTAVAHYHRTGSPLGLGHTVNFGRPWLPSSECAYGLLSRPYLDGPDLEWLDADGGRVRFLWLVPITREEVQFKKARGLDALEESLERAGVNYVDPRRPSVV
jgi:hypothetical protein